MLGHTNLQAIGIAPQLCCSQPRGWMGQYYLEGSRPIPVDMVPELNQGKKAGTQNSFQIVEQEVTREHYRHMALANAT